VTRSSSFGPLARTVAFLVLVVVIVAAFALVEPRYLTKSNLSAVTRHMSANGLAALGLTFVVVVRRFDLSFPGIACFGAMTVGFLIAAGQPLWLAIAVGMVAGAAIGAVNGWAVGYGGLPDIVTTIATGSIAAGLAFVYSGGRTIFQNFMPSGILDLNDVRLLGINLSVYILLAVAAAAHVLLHRSRFGAAFHATGENDVSAWFSGIRTRLATLSAFVICGVTAVMAVVLLLAESGTADTNDGAGFLMPAYAGVFLGAAILGGASIPATLAGTVLITVLLDGFSLLGVPYYYGDGVVSTILLVGVLAFDSRLRGALERLAGFFSPAATGRAP